MRNEDLGIINKAALGLFYFSGSEKSEAKYKFFMRRLVFLPQIIFTALALAFLSFGTSAAEGGEGDYKSSTVQLPLRARNSVTQVQLLLLIPRRAYRASLV
jgi:hypothetical protein